MTNLETIPLNLNNKSNTDWIKGPSYIQIHGLNGDSLHKMGHRGEGIVKAIPEAGFYTSMSCRHFFPLIAGMAACLWQVVPSRNNLELPVKKDVPFDLFIYDFAGRLIRSIPRRYARAGENRISLAGLDPRTWQLLVKIVGQHPVTKTRVT